MENPPGPTRPAQRPPPVESDPGAAVARNATDTSEEKPLPDDRFINRELSWLDLNARVMSAGRADEGDDSLMERAFLL